MSMMKHKGYIANIEFDNEDRIFVGRLLGIEDVVTFHGESVSELEAAFHDAVEHYLEVCEQTGRPAQKPYSGRFALRMPPELHAQVAAKAATAGKSLNQWFIDTVQNNLQADSR